VSGDVAVYADARCDGHHSLASPLPDACLGVIDTDRPHQTDTPHVVPAGHVQIESALAAAQIEGAGKPAHAIFFEDAYRFGLVDRVDAELIVKHADYVPSLARFAPPGPIHARAKLNVVAEDGFVPAVTLVPWIAVPMDRSQALRAGPFVFFGWELPWRFELEVNAGFFVSGAPKPPLALVVASALTWTIAGDLRVFADIYATGWDVAFGTGVLWAFTRDVQIDLGTYLGVNGDEPTATPFLGLSFRR
jgi:hypothetical protein